jgi:molecular chaperone DnaK
MARIGIDLGMTQSVVAVVGREGTRIVESRKSRPSTASVVGQRTRWKKGAASDQLLILVGDVALDNFEMAPEDTIIDIKRLIGRSIGDPEVERVRQWAMYKVVPPPDGGVGVRVVMGGKEYSPEEISTMILRKLKDEAEFRLNDEVTHAVITVPAYFSPAQMNATRQAGILTGLNVLAILDEHMATAIAFGIDQPPDRMANHVIIYDLAQDFNVTVLMHQDQVFAPLTRDGELWLGGDSFDQALVDHVLRHIREQHGFDVKNDIQTPEEKKNRLRFLAALMKTTQRAKMQLSHVDSAILCVPSILKAPEGRIIDVELKITRNEFEEMIGPAVGKSMAITARAINAAGLTCDDIDYVLMLGGSTFIPLVRKAVEGVFGAAKVVRHVHPKHCVAAGAAIVANTN